MMQNDMLAVLLVLHCWCVGGLELITIRTQTPPLVYIDLGDRHANNLFCSYRAAQT